MTPPNLRKQVLLARCELDRLELTAGIQSMRSRVRGRVDQVRQATPWLLVAAPVVGLLVARMFRGRRLAVLLVASQVALQLRRWWPLIAGRLRPRNAPTEGVLRGAKGHAK